ncbi:MAG: isoleucine--tRNA ligase [Phycisphaerales bacterium]|nr:isoleucine--tRNA ligase [Phycisphaerales bacterium]
MSDTTDTTATDKPNYKKTLNLPRTSFPMKANLVQNEPASQKRWARAKLYDAIQEARCGSPRFVFHDGPPYANGSIHLGHLLNKVLKDLVVRSKTMAGFDCPFVPGWDCHGLPIEHKVMTELVASGKAEILKNLADDDRIMAVRRACEKDAAKYVKLQSGQMQRLLTLADYEHPYLTMTHDYEGAVLEAFADMLGQGLVYRALKPVHWSIANETALAEAELEYRDVEDTSIYVMYEAEDAQAVAEAFGCETTGPRFMIWTTTPWTLPANLAVAVHERAFYALVATPAGDVILAEELAASVLKLGGLDASKIKGRVTGDKLVGLRYRNPLCPTAPVEGDIYRVVPADYVTLEDGTGLVHTAPGHGAEDYFTGLSCDLPIYCPVQDDGTYDDTVPDWLRGVSVWKANGMVVDRLRETGHLFHDQMFTHSYPHDWRSKTPVIFRATEQWFITVDRPTKREGKNLRDLALAETASSIEFIPEWGRNRMRGMLESRPDWCLSRQRSWGLPIPAFVMPDGSTFMTGASVHAVAKVVRERGSEYWFQASPSDLLAHYKAADDAEAPPDLDVASLRKGHDIFDVWFESGTSWNAVMRERDLGYPVDLYLEGSDQHRGWFQLSLLPGLASTGRSPYKSVLTHGFIVDKDGLKMSKSGGNALDVEELLKHFGADVCRWWVASLAYENDIKADLDFFKVASDAYRKVRNTLRFMLSNLSDFAQADHRVDVGGFAPTSLEAWVLSKFNDVSAAIRQAYEAYDFRGATQMIYNLCNDTLSAGYLTAAKDRLYCDRVDSPRRRATQTVLFDLADGLTRLLAPIMPHTADEAYRALWNVDQGDAETSVHLQTFLLAIEASADAGWEAVLQSRERALAALERNRASEGGIENPLDTGVTLPDPDGVLKRFDPVDLADLIGISRVAFDAKSEDVVVHDLRDELRCERSWKRDGTVKQRGDGGLLSDRDAEAVGQA